MPDSKTTIHHGFIVTNNYDFERKAHVDLSKEKLADLIIEHYKNTLDKCWISKKKEFDNFNVNHIRPEAEGLIKEFDSQLWMN